MNRTPSFSSALVLLLIVGGLADFMGRVADKTTHNEVVGQLTTID